MIGVIRAFFAQAALSMIKYVMSSLMVEVVKMWYLLLWWRNLHFVIVDHPHPYNLVWLENSQKVNVYKQCLVQFTIGDIYCDKVLCDVIPMDACHLILGRPWQYDRHTMHDGKHNTYTFEKDGKTITLVRSI